MFFIGTNAQSLKGEKTVDRKENTMIMRIGKTIILNDKITQKCCGNCIHREPRIWAKCELLQLTTGFLNHACTGYDIQKEKKQWTEREVRGMRMRCDLCPLCSPEGEYGDNVCPEMDGPYGMEHKDGMGGCRHPWNWANKREREYENHLVEMAESMAKWMKEHGDD